MVSTTQARDSGDAIGLTTRLREFGGKLKDGILRGGGRGPWWKLRISTIIALSVLTLGIAGRAYNVPWVEWVRVKTFDIYQRIEPRKIQNLPVGIIDIDEKSLFEIGQWPWPRTVLAPFYPLYGNLGKGSYGTLLGTGCQGRAPEKHTEKALS